MSKAIQEISRKSQTASDQLGPSSKGQVLDAESAKVLQSIRGLL
jgi:hypothetical protein